MTWKVPRMVKQPGGKTGSAPAGGRIQMPNKAVPLRPISVADAAKEIAAQRKIVEGEIRVPVFYAYWLDYPCIKGIFYMASSDVYAYIDSVAGKQYTRKDRSGDYVATPAGRKQLAQLDKVYLPLLQMGDFMGLMREIGNVLKSSVPQQSAEGMGGGLSTKA